jgi:hypothetical protein
VAGGAATPGGAQLLPGLQQQLGALPPTSAQEAAAKGLTHCAPMIDRMVTESVNAPNVSQATQQTSLWATQNAERHIFQSVIGVSQPGNPPDALVAVVAAPLSPTACDGAAVRIYPLAVPCDTADAAVRNGGQFLFMLKNTRVLLDANRQRLMLLPGANNTCIAVAVESYISG